MENMQSWKICIDFIRHGFRKQVNFCASVSKYRWLLLAEDKGRRKPINLVSFP